MASRKVYPVNDVSYPPASLKIVQEVVSPSSRTLEILFIRHHAIHYFFTQFPVPVPYEYKI